MQLVKSIASIGLATFIGSAGFAQQSPQIDLDIQAAPTEILPQAEADPIAEQVVENRYRIGIDCQPISDAMRAQLGLDDAGLIVNHVLDSAPAGLAGIKRFDVILKANGKPVYQISDLVRIVNEAKTTEIPLLLLRQGKEQVVSVTPEQRNEQEVNELRNGLRRRMRTQMPGFGQFGPNDDAIRQQLEMIEGLLGSNPFGGGLGANGWRQVMPGIMFENGEFDPFQSKSQLPNGFNFQMQVERNGDGPANIKVQHGGESWEVSEDNLDDLPEEVRPMVESMLNGNRGALHGMMVAPNMRRLAPATPLAPRPQRNDSQRQLEKEFDGLKLQMRELQDAIRSYQEDK